jgi:hypothetical protein
MTDEPADNDDNVAMPRADEAMYIQEVDTASDVTVDGRSPAASPARPFVVGVVDFEDGKPSRAAVALKLSAAALSVAAVVAFFPPAYLDAAMRGQTPAAVPVRPLVPGDLVRAVMLVDSKPSGAAVEVAGKDRGPTPAVFDLECQLGDPVVARVSLAGYKTARHTVPCSAGEPPGMRVKVKLTRATGD